MTEQTRKQVEIELEEMVSRFGDEYPVAVEYLLEAMKVLPTNEFFTAKERFLARLRGEVLVLWDAIDPFLTGDLPNKVAAIKEYRARSGLGLKESRDAIEERIVKLHTAGKTQIKPHTYYVR